MLIRPLSDLHLDVNCDYKFNICENKNAITIIAGDIYENDEYIKNWFLSNFRHSRVFFCLGNHDHYDSMLDIDAEIEYLRKIFPKTDSNITFLENDYVKINGYIIFGATLYTDFCLFGYEMQEKIGKMSEHLTRDFIKSKKKAGNNTFRNLNWTDYVGMFNKTVKNIEIICKRNKNKKIIIFTHFSPLSSSIDETYKANLLTAFWVSNLEWLPKKYSNIRLWHFGHTHINIDVTINNCRFINNGRGYINGREGKKFNPNLVVDV